jgi:hypothetical protein
MTLSDMSDRLSLLSSHSMSSGIGDGLEDDGQRMRMVIVILL